MVQTVLDICLKRICSLDTGAFSALEIPDDNCMRSINLFTYLQHHVLRRMFQLVKASLLHNIVRRLATAVVIYLENVDVDAISCVV